MPATFRGRRGDRIRGVVGVATVAAVVALRLGIPALQLVLRSHHAAASAPTLTTIPTFSPFHVVPGPRTDGSSASPAEATPSPPIAYPLTAAKDALPTPAMMGTGWTTVDTTSDVGGTVGGDCPGSDTVPLVAWAQRELSLGASPTGVDGGRAVAHVAVFASAADLAHHLATLASPEYQRCVGDREAAALERTGAAASADPEVARAPMPSGVAGWHLTVTVAATVDGASQVFHDDLFVVATAHMRGTLEVSRCCAPFPAAWEGRLVSGFLTGMEAADR